MVDENIFKNKPFFKEIYKRIYCEILEDIYINTDNSQKILEIGSGGHGFIKEIDKKVITSDIEKHKNCDLVVNAECIPFENESLDAIIGIQVLHHIINPSNFLHEAVRTLRHNGVIILFEPSYGLVSTLLHKFFHSEPFEKKQSFEDAMYSNKTNQAVSYILFKKYKKKLFKQLPQLSVVKIKKRSFLEYIMSGGFHHKAYVPEKLITLFKGIDKMLMPFMGLLSIHQIIILKRKVLFNDNQETSDISSFNGNNDELFGSP